MKTLTYIVDNLDAVGYLQGIMTPSLPDEVRRGKGLLNDLLELFPDRERIQTSYNSIPFRNTQFGSISALHKFRDYQDPNFSIRLYRKYERRNVNRIMRTVIMHMELLISGENNSLLDEKKNSIDALLYKYNEDSGQKLKIQFKSYPE